LTTGLISGFPQYDKNEDNMPIWKRILVSSGVAVAGFGLLYVAFYFIFLELIVDLWWFRSLEFERYFWLRLLYRYFISGGVTLVFFLVFFLNFWVASNFLGLGNSNGRTGALNRKTLVHKFKSGALDVYCVLSLILAVIIALPFYHQWEAALLYFFAPGTGIQDPVYEYDVSFYLFSVPIYGLIQKELLSVFSILLAAVAFLYWLEHHILAERGEPYPRGVKIHLTSLVLAVCLLVGWGFMLQRFGLLYADGHEPVFFGPGYIEINYHLPLIWTAMLTFLGAAVSAIVLIHSQGQAGKWPLFGFLTLFLAALGLREVQFIPDLITKFIVRPNPVKTEQNYMQNNIDATLSAYKLKDVKTLDYPVSPAPESDLGRWINREHLHNIPVWDRELLDDVYNQLQGIRSYYKFSDVDEDRYLINGRIQQVNLSAREMNIDKLPKEAQSWENKYLRYTHGYAAVVTPAAQNGGQPIDWYLRDLNLLSDVGFKVEKPDIYYGTEKYDNAIVPNELEVVDISGTASDSGDEYAGAGGIPIPSLFRKLLFAVYFRDEKIFFSTNINQKSRMLIRRNVRDRIATLTPYLALDNDPYLVVTQKNLFWIQDAYTISDKYPVSKPLDVKFPTGSGDEFDARINYIRNSVKIVVNAYNGAVDYYVVDPEDPIVGAYRSAYPGFFKPLEVMPGELKTHLRYPRDLFYHQLRIYSKYHQRDPALFYQQAETWDFPEVRTKRMMPYFLTTEIEGCPDLEKFILVEPMTPIRRNNLSVLAIAGSLNFESCGVAYSDRIAVYKFRKDIQVDGPAQISARIDQDPVIREQFTLWDQHGSVVNLGRMVIMPLEHSVLYIQPVYLSSIHTRIPELMRVIVSMGNEVVMEKSLEEAFLGLEKRLKEGRLFQPALRPASPTIEGGEISATRPPSENMEKQPTAEQKR
jgi:uncharacterized membrane protein (UPF0182 family)